MKSSSKGWNTCSSQSRKTYRKVRKEDQTAVYVTARSMILSMRVLLLTISSLRGFDSFLPLTFPDVLQTDGQYLSLFRYTKFHRGI